MVTAFPKIPGYLKFVFPPPGSSTDVSEDWEKDFDLDMTEEEVQLALSKIEDSGEVSDNYYIKG